MTIKSRLMLTFVVALFTGFLIQFGLLWARSQDLSHSGSVRQLNMINDHLVAALEDRLQTLAIDPSSWSDLDEKQTQAQWKKVFSHQDVRLVLARGAQSALEIAIYDSFRRPVYASRPEALGKSDLAQRVREQRSASEEFQVTQEGQKVFATSRYSKPLGIFVVVMENPRFIHGLKNLLFGGWLVGSLASLALILIAVTSILAFSFRSEAAFVKGICELAGEARGSQVYGFPQFLQMVRRLRERLDLLSKQNEDYKRLSEEVKSARFIQSNFFPPDSVREAGFSIGALHGSASECTGDWWYFKKIGSRVFIVLGDATGHGMPAALVTSAALASASTIAWNEELLPSDILSSLNRAIYRVGQSKILMTAICVRIDLQDRSLLFANASHDIGFIVDSEGAKPMIAEANGHRLGDIEAAVYVDEKSQMTEGQILVLNTDGILEIKDNQGKGFSERKYVRALGKNFANDMGSRDYLQKVCDYIVNVNKIEVLPDDATLIAIKLDQAHEAAA